MTSSVYLHGTHTEEQDRLARLNDILNEASLREMALKKGSRVLDLGCGLAQLTRAMALEVGRDGYILGIDRSADQLAEALRRSPHPDEGPLVELREGDVFDLPLSVSEWGSFDVAHTRFLLEHIPDPLTVVKEMVMAVRVGGRIILEDDTHDTLRLWPEPPGVYSLWAAYLRTYELLGNDPLVGHRLVSLLHQAGARPVRNTWLFFGGCAGDLVFPLLVDNLVGLFEGAKGSILQTDILDEPSFRDAIEALHQWKQRPDAALWLAVAWAEGIKDSTGSS